MRRFPFALLAGFCDVKAYDLLKLIMYQHFPHLENWAAFSD
jgi:hypothetical protein